MAYRASCRQPFRFASGLPIAALAGIAAVAGLGGLSRPAAAVGFTFHLSQDGLCNRSSQKQQFHVSLENHTGPDKCDTARMDDRTNFQTKSGGTLDPGQCATVSFYIEAPLHCGASIYISAAGGECGFDIGIDNGSRDTPTLKGCSGPLVSDHGDEQIQVTIRDPK